jgi:hypothetical protein
MIEMRRNVSDVYVPHEVLRRPLVADECGQDERVKFAISHALPCTLLRESRYHEEVFRPRTSLTGIKLCCHDDKRTTVTSDRRAMVHRQVALLRIRHCAFE